MHFLLLQYRGVNTRCIHASFASFNASSHIPLIVHALFRLASVVCEAVGPRDSAAEYSEMASSYRQAFMAASPISSSFPRHRDLKSDKERSGRYHLCGMQDHSPRTHFACLLCQCIACVNSFANSWKHSVASVKRSTISRPSHMAR